MDNTAHFPTLSPRVDEPLIESSSSGAAADVAQHLEKPASPLTLNSDRGYGLNLTAYTGRAANTQQVRAARLEHILSEHGAIFARGHVFLQAAGAEVSPEDRADKMYGLSVSCQRIELFISHSWDDHKIFKWLALLDVHNRKLAIICSTFLWFAVSLVGAALRVRAGHHVLLFRDAGLVYMCLPCVVLCLVYAYGHLLWTEVAGMRCFLDKLCIHQTNHELKQKGVNSLGHCLEDCDRLLMLWSDTYRERLWCIFEIATFGRYHTAAEMIMQPLWLSPFLLAGLLANILVMLASVVFEGSSCFHDFMAYWGTSRGNGMFWVITNLVAAPLMCHAIRKKVMEHSAAETALSTFALEMAKVTIESDRALVYEEIEILYETTGKFEAFVHTQMLQSMREVFGPARDVPFDWVLFMCLPYLWYASTDAFAASNADVSAQGFVDWGSMARFYIFLYVGQALLIFPITLKAVGACAASSTSLPIVCGMILDLLVYELLMFILSTAWIWLGMIFFFGVVEDLSILPGA